MFDFAFIEIRSLLKFILSVNLDLSHIPYGDGRPRRVRPRRWECRKSSAVHSLLLGEQLPKTLRLSNARTYVNTRFYERIYIMADHWCNDLVIIYNWPIAFNRVNIFLLML